MGKLDMISAARLLVPVPACLMLLIASAWEEPAIAQGQACKADAVTASGRAKFRPFTKTKELEGRGAAMADAVASWQRDVSAKFGEQWKLWSKAKDTTFTCAPTKTAKLGLPAIGCTISGRPCSSPASTGGKVVADDDRGRGKAGDEARWVGGRKRWESSAYEREMARQEHLAAARERAESGAYEREMARQESLAAARDRAESRRRGRYDED